MRTPILLSPAVALVTALASGCYGQVTAEPAYAPAPPPPPAPVVVSEAPPPPAAPQPPAEEEVVYEAQPPIVNIEAYPSVVYGGVTVYYVGGVWYRRGPNGWGRYRVEPPGLARERRAHAADVRWRREGEPRPAPPGAAEIQRPERPARREERREERR